MDCVTADRLAYSRASFDNDVYKLKIVEELQAIGWEHVISIDPTFTQIVLSSSFIHSLQLPPPLSGEDRTALDEQRMGTQSATARDTTATATITGAVGQENKRKRGSSCSTSSSSRSSSGSSKRIKLFLHINIKAPAKYLTECPELHTDLLPAHFAAICGPAVWAATETTERSVTVATAVLPSSTWPTSMRNLRGVKTAFDFHANRFAAFVQVMLDLDALWHNMDGITDVWAGSDNCSSSSTSSRGSGKSSFSQTERTLVVMGIEIDSHNKNKSESYSRNSSISSSHNSKAQAVRGDNGVNMKLQNMGSSPNNKQAIPITVIIDPYRPRNVCTIKSADALIMDRWAARQHLWDEGAAASSSFSLGHNIQHILKCTLTPRNRCASTASIKNCNKNETDGVISNLTVSVDIDKDTDKEKRGGDNEGGLCGICYSDDISVISGEEEVVKCTCVNTCCNAVFHACCLREWLKSLSVSKVSFGVMYGVCPYCSAAISVKLQ